MDAGGDRGLSAVPGGISGLVCGVSGPLPAGATVAAVGLVGFCEEPGSVASDVAGALLAPEFPVLGLPLSAVASG